VHENVLRVVASQPVWDYLEVMRSSKQTLSFVIALSAVLMTTLFASSALAAPAAPVITTPSAATTYSKNTVVTVGGTITPAAGLTVTVYDGGTLLIQGLAPTGSSWSFNPTLGPGLHTITAWASISGEEPSPPSNQKAVVVDLTAPVLSATAPVNGSTIANPAPAFVFNWTEEMPQTLECRVDASPTWTACGSGSQLAYLADGAHTFYARMTDLAGNTGSAQTSFTVDTTPPNAPTITGGPNGYVASKSATFTFTAAEPGGSFQCSIENDPDWSTCTSGKNYSALADGLHTFRVRQLDALGNAGAAADRSFVVDTVGPTMQPLAGPTGTTGLTSATIYFAADEEGATYTCSLDAAPATACISPKELTGLANGAHSFTVTPRDSLSNVGTPATINWTVDTSQFSVEIFSGPTGYVNTLDNTFTFVASVPSGTTYQCKIDSGVYSACSSPFSTGNLAAGAHTFTVFAVNGGNESVAVSRSWTIDKTGPTINVNSPDGVASVAPNGSVSFTASDPSGAVMTECAIDAEPKALCASPFPYSNLSHGAHSVTITGTDSLGNVATFVRNFSVDSNPPGAPTITGGPNGYVASSSATFNFTGAEPGSSFECLMDGDLPWTACSFTKSYTGLSEGLHTFRVRQLDALSNTGPTTERSFAVDTTGPVMQPLNGPSGTTGLSSATIGFAANEVDVTYTCKLDGGTPYSCTSPALVSGLGNGAHSFSVTASDSLGNAGAAETINWTVDSSLFTTQIFSGPNERVGSADNTFTFTSSTPAGSSYMCKIDSGSYNACSSPFQTGSLAEGNHNFSVYAVNGTSQSPAVTHSWTIDLSGPAIAITGPTDGQTVAPTGGVQFTAVDPAGESMTHCAIDTGDSTPCGSPYAYSSLPGGPHQVTITAIDPFGNTSILVRNFYVDDTGPSVSITAKPASLSLSTTATFEFSASESGSTFMCAIDSGAATSCTSGQSWTLEEGPHTFLVQATDQFGNTGDSSAYNWTISTTGEAAVTITSPADGATLTDNTPQIEFTATGFFGERTVTCGFDAGLMSVCSSPWQMPTLADGPHQLTVMVSTSTQNKWKTISLNIDTTPPTSGITSRPRALENRTTAQFIFGASEAGASFECSLDGDTWASCSSGISYSSLSEGEHTFELRATDQHGNAQQNPTTATWTVDLTPPVGSVSVSNAGGGLANPTFAVSSNDPDASAVCSIDGGAIAPCAGSWKPDGWFRNGQHTLVATFTDRAGNSSQVSIPITIAVAPDPLPSACFAKGLLISDLVPSGKKVTLRGFARTGSVGQTVSIRSKFSPSKVVATATVQGDGSYVASFRAPKKSLWKSKKAWYRASIGSQATPWAQLSRPIATVSASYSGGRLQVSGQVAKPVVSKAKAKITISSGCGHPFDGLANVKIAKSGKFKVSAPFSPASTVVYVMVRADVKGSGKKKRTAVNSFVIPVVTD
jgi:hypothetical protein